MPEKVVGHLEILFPLADDTVNDAFIFLDEPFLDNCLHPDLWGELAKERKRHANGGRTTHKMQKYGS